MMAEPFPIAFSIYLYNFESFSPVSKIYSSRCVEELVLNIFNNSHFQHSFLYIILLSDSPTQTQSSVFSLWVP